MGSVSVTELEDTFQIAGTVDDSKDAERLGLRIVGQQVAMYPPPPDTWTGEPLALAPHLRCSSEHVKRRPKVRQDSLGNIETSALLGNVLEDVLKFCPSKG